MNLLFNPVYRLKADRGKVYVFHRGGIVAPEDRHDEGFCGAIHPLQALILSFLRGQDLNDAINEIREFIEIDKNVVETFVFSLLDCPNQKAMAFGNDVIRFPSKLIISSSKQRDLNYNPEIFLLDQVDFSLGRPQSVSRLTLMVNNTCMTNCYYCYADKRKPVPNKIPFARYEELIEEAYKLGVVSIDVIGGEFFLYEDWKRMLKMLREYGYSPLISTKAFLDEESVNFLKQVGCEQLQISLDSMYPDTLIKLGVGNDGYLQKLIRTFRMLDDAGIKVAVHSILTQRNATSDDFKSIYDFLCSCSNILYWKPDVGSESIYSADDIRGSITPDDESILRIRDLCAGLSQDAPFPVLYEGLNPRKEEESVSKTWEAFNDRSMCSGNYFNMFILPDGKVTICEELYWHPAFIIGDVNTQSLQDVWTSEAAVDLYNMTQESINQKSPCKACQDFKICRFPRQICYRDVVRKHGVDYWDFPDVKCPRSKFSYI